MKKEARQYKAMKAIGQLLSNKPLIDAVSEDSWAGRQIEELRTHLKQYRKQRQAADPVNTVERQKGAIKKAARGMNFGRMVIAFDVTTSPNRRVPGYSINRWQHNVTVPITWKRKVYNAFYADNSLPYGHFLVLSAEERSTNQKGILLFEVTYYEFKTGETKKGYVAKEVLTKKAALKDTPSEAYGLLRTRVGKVINKEMRVET